MGDEEAAGAIEQPELDLVSALEASRSADILHHRLPAASAGLLSIFHPLAYRGVVAGWPDTWRERWGRRANELEETGLSWRDAEAQAFVEVWNIFRQGHPTLPLASSDAERN